MTDITHTGIGLMRRRDLITIIGGAAVWPLSARAQQKDPVIGFLSTRSPEEASSHTAGFVRGLNDAGYTDGQSVRIEYRWARGQYGRLTALAAELVTLGPSVLSAGGDPAALALKAATKTIPIAFLIGDDPVRVGLVDSLNRPGGNATGVSLITSALGAKRVELLLQLVPSARAVALLINPTNPNAEPHTQEVRSAAAALRRDLIVLKASAESQFEAAFTELAKQGAVALVVQNDPFFDTRRDHLIAIAAHHAIPAIYHIREFPTAGGLVSYGPNLVSAYRELGAQTGRILKGANPRTLPVVRPNTFELVINTKTAKALGIMVPESILVSADEVID